MRKNLDLEIEKSKLSQSLGIVVAVTLLLIGICVYGYQRKLLLKERQFRQAQDQIRSFTTQLKENEVLKKEMKGQVNQLIEREKYLSEQLLRRIAIFNQLQAAKYLKDEQCPEVVEAVDVLYNNFTRRIRKSYPSLTQGDILICALLKLRFSTAIIASLMGISPSSVTKRKQRIKERMGLSPDISEKSIQLDTFLSEY